MSVLLLPVPRGHYGQVLMRAARLCSVRRSLLPVMCAAAQVSCSYDHTGPGAPRAEVDAAALHFTSEVDTASVTVRNTGGSTLHWQIINQSDWLNAPDSGTVAAGAAATLLMRADTGAMPAGDHTGSLTLKGNHFGPSISIDLHLHIAPAPIAQLASGDTLMEHPRELGGLVITNAGKGVLHWTAQSSEAWLTLESAANGSTAPRDSSAIAFRIDRDVATTDTVADIIIESDDADSPLVVSVNVRGIPPPSYTMLPGPVTATVGMQALIGASLTLVDVGAGTVRSVPLPKPGIELVVMSDRTIVSHDSSFSVVNTSTLAVVQHVPLDFEVEAMAVSSGWVRLVPRGAASARIIGIVLTDPTRRNEYVGDEPPLHDLAASGPIVYGAYDGGFARYSTLDPWGDLAIDTVVGVPYAPGAIRFWIGEGRLFTSSGSVVSLLPLANYLQVVGRLEWPGTAPTPPIRALSGAHFNEPVFVVRDSIDGRPSSPHVWIYDPDYNPDPAAITLPEFEWAGQMVPVEPYAYVGEYGRSHLIVQRAITGDGANQWALLRLYY